MSGSCGSTEKKEQMEKDQAQMETDQAKKQTAATPASSETKGSSCCG